MVNVKRGNLQDTGSRASCDRFPRRSLWKMCIAGTVTRFGLYNIINDEGMDGEGLGDWGPATFSALYAASLPKACVPTETAMHLIA